MLKILWDRDHDYLSVFVPLVVEAIRRANMSVVALADLQAAVGQEFGLRIPHHALGAVLKRAQRAGYLTMADHAYRPVRERVEALEFDRVQREMTRLHDDVVRDLRDFVKEHADVDWSTAEAEEALLDQLRQRRMQLGSKREEPVVPAKDSGRTRRFLVAAYITHLREERSPRLTDVDALAQGYMLASILYLPDPGRIAQRFRGTDIFLDTPLLIHALGYAGRAREAPANELLKLLYEVGANLRCYRHTLDELSGALDACSRHVRRGPDAALRGPAVETVQHFLAAGFTASDVELLAAQVDRALAALRISVVETPGYERRAHVIDEKGLAETIKAAIVPYREGPLEKDVASIAAVVRERGGRITTRVEECSAILVTSNFRLVRVVRDFFANGSSSHVVPPAITDYTLTNLLWLKRPTAAPDLPIKRLMADCYATLQPDDELWSAFETEAAKLRDNGTITADDYYDLRYSLAAKTELTQRTLGDAEAFSQGTVLDVLRRVKEHRESVARQAVSAELTEAQSGRRRAEDTAETHKYRELTQRYTLSRRAQRMAAWSTRVLSGVLVVLLATGAWASSPWGSPLLAATVTGYVLGVLAVLAIGAGFFSLLTGGTVLSVSRALEIHLEALFRRLWYWIASMPV
jgi:hypothetical protein